MVVKRKEAGRNQGVLPKTSGFEKILKQHRTMNNSTVIAAEKISLPGRVEKHFDENVKCTWAYHTHKVLYVTLKYASDGYTDGAEIIGGIKSSVAPGDGFMAAKMSESV